MAVYGWDASHYDGPLTTAILARAKAEGVAFFTHKLGEGLSDTEGSMDDTALAAARDVGIELLGGYLVPRSNATVAAQVDRWLSLADAGEPWWCGFPGWFWQIDLERWPYDNVPASVGIACAQEIRRRTGRWTILYASHSQYGDQLAAWDGPLWNADYTGRPAGSIAAMYPGDDWAPLHGTWRGGWAPYSGRAPAVLQYTSSATIAGLTTCDANAFRGSIDEFRALVTGGTTMADPMSEEAERVLTAMCTRLMSNRGAGESADRKRIALVHPWAPEVAEVPNPIDWLIGRLDQLEAAVKNVSASGAAPTQAQVDAAILNAMQDPGVQKGIGDAIAAHLHVT